MARRHLGAPSSGAPCPQPGDRHDPERVRCYGRCRRARPWPGCLRWPRRSASEGPGPKILERGCGYTAAVCPVRSSTPPSEHSSATCSTSSVPTRRPSSRRGRPAISPRTWSCASTTHLAGPGLVLPGAWGRLAERRQKSARAEGLHLARRDVPVGTAARLLPHRMGAPAPEPQRVLRPPRGRAQSQRSWSPDERACHGRGPVAQRQPRALVPRAAAARRRARASVGGDRADRPGPAGGTRCPHRRTSGRAAALPLRPAGRGTGRGEGPPAAVEAVRRARFGM